MQIGTGSFPSTIILGPFGTVPSLNFLFSEDLAKILASWTDPGH